MMKSRGMNPAVWLGVFASLSGCAAVESFTSPDPVGNGVRGKVWTTQAYLEPNPNNVAYDPVTNATFQRYSVAASGTQAYLAASIYDSASAKFQGYQRLFQSESGWSSSGPGFSIIANGAAGLSYAAISPGPGGSWLSVFQASQAAGAGATQTTHTVANNGVWQPASVNAGSPGNGGPIFATTSDQSYGSPVSIAFDSLGRAYIATAVSSPDNFVLKRWSQAGGIDLKENGVTATGPLIEARFDGVQWVCTFAQSMATFAIVQQCFDSTNVDAWGTTGPTVQTPILSPGRLGFSTATAGDGVIVLADYELVSAVPQVVVRAVSAGVLQSGSTTVSAGMPGTYAVAATTTAAPQIVHLGSGSFLVAWTGADAGSNTAMFYALYVPNVGWTTPAMIGSAQASPSYIGPIHLFTNEDGNAGIAASFYSTATSTLMMTARYQNIQGWLPMQTFGNGCATDTPTLTPNSAFCTQRPQGAITSNGDTIVVFPDQDPSGHFRLGGVEFK